MFSLIKQVFYCILSFSCSLATKCVSLNDEKKKKCNEICNVLSPKICVLKEADIVVKTLYMIKNKNEAMAKNISRDCKCKFNSTKCNSNQN